MPPLQPAPAQQQACGISLLPLSLPPWPRSCLLPASSHLLCPSRWRDTEGGQCGGHRSGARDWAGLPVQGCTDTTWLCLIAGGQERDFAAPEPPPAPHAPGTAATSQGSSAVGCQELQQGRKHLQLLPCALGGLWLLHRLLARDHGAVQEPAKGFAWGGQPVGWAARAASAFARGHLFAGSSKMLRCWKQDRVGQGCLGRCCRAARSSAGLAAHQQGQGCLPRAALLPA